MESNEENDKILLPHHEQQSLCTSRLPYRQGRKLTAVKVYSITKESNHLLIFGVPSLNLRQEAKALFIKFGGLVQFHISKEHASEPFTETYHAQYDKTQPARLAKRMLDTKNFYGGVLHVCYAPEFETIEETRQKLIQRQKDVVYRLRNLQKDKMQANVTGVDNILNNELKSKDLSIVERKVSSNVENEPKKLNMGEINTISIGKQIRDVCDYKNVITKRFKPYYKKNNQVEKNKINNLNLSQDIEIVDCTNIDTEVVSNINEALNYNKFGNEVIRKIPEKPVNKIQFHLNKNS